jgi:hypothetical protein
VRVRGAATGPPRRRRRLCRPGRSEALDEGAFAPQALLHLEGGAEGGPAFREIR